MILIWIIVSIILFSIIVLIHEWGHFASARFFGVKVEEFWLGIPPRAKKLFLDKKWTLFSLNWLPLWGFVKLTWEQPNTFLVFDKNKKSLNNWEIESKIKEDKAIFDKDWQELWKYEKDEILKKIKENDSEHNLMNKPERQQAIIILAWVFMNFLLAWIIFSILFFVWVKPIWINSQIETDLDLKLIPNQQQAIDSGFIEKIWVSIKPIKWSIAENAWLKTWQIITHINNSKIKKPQELIDIVSQKKWENITIKWFENNPDYKEWCECIKEFSFEVNLKVWNDWKIWSYIWQSISINENFTYNYWLFESIKNWAIETKNQVLLTFKWLKILIKKIISPEKPEERQQAINQVSWPIWIVDFISNSMSAWFVFLVIIWALISISLWVFNLLPIPALDWWRFLFITINWLIKKLFGKKAISQNIENIIHITFFLFLIALSLLIAYNDIEKIISN